jgi:transcriptional regulator GlxA family with amidase domain
MVAQLNCSEAAQAREASCKIAMAAMTNICDFLPMAHSVALIVYPGFELLDASGPASVFAGANHSLCQHGKPPFYAIETASPHGGPVASSSGIALQTRQLSTLLPARVDTLLVVGAEADSVRAVTVDPRLRRWLPRCARVAKRFGSVCAGTFVLAALRLLDGKRVATHWDACVQLAEMHPAVTVDADSVYVNDGNVWTSAGVATGIDMALAMVSHDLGAGIAGEVAKRLVIYARRPGYQSQFSPLLRAQAKAGSPFAELIDWLQANLDRPLNVPCLAARVGLSERSFHRKFLAATGATPARFIEAVRLDAARMLLSQTHLSLKAIAAQVGLSPPVRLVAAFERRFGVTPRLFREMHASS